MAVLNRNCLVLRGVPVASDVVTVLERFAVNPANARTPALIPSYQRHLSTRTPSAATDSRPRHEHAASSCVGREARRAGRPGSPAGVPERRRPARIAGRAIQLGWRQAVGVVSPSAAWCLDRLTVKRKAGAGKLLPEGYSHALALRTKPTGSLTSLPALEWSGIRGEAEAAAIMPSARMPMASIRGK
jgi:hypothetical protein